MTNHDHSLDTRLQHITAAEHDGGIPVATPIFQTSTYELPSTEIGARIAAEYHPQSFYTRYGSPNAAQVEAIVADLEGADTAIATGSGMAAIAAAVLSHVRAGDHVVAQNTHYAATLSLLNEWLPKNGVEVTQVEQSDSGAFAAAMRPETRLVYCETPTNPTLELTDLAVVADIAREAGAISVVDNTFASSFNQQPHALGIDLVVHSATKYLNGHSDVTAGVVSGSRSLLEPVWEYTRVHGPVLHPMEAWLLARGLKTYALRMRQHNASTIVIAEALCQFDNIDAVHYPGLATHPQHALAKKQMTGGFGGMLSFSLAGDTVERQYHSAQSVLSNVKLCKSAVSLGSTETLITHPASLIYAHQSLEQLETAGVEPGLVRLSVGLESPEDLLADLRRAIEQQ
jgi:cystathionine beta-lyase/cystathionine gamma-synthase